MIYIRVKNELVELWTTIKRDDLLAVNVDTVPKYVEQEGKTGRLAYTPSEGLHYRYFEEDVAQVLGE